jgi:hypothetical protein
MKKTTIILSLMLALLSIALSAQETARRTKEISMLDGTVTLEVRKGVDFPCIGISLNDKTLNTGMGTYIEIKKRGEFYLIEEWKGKKYTNMNDGLTDALKDIFNRFYDGKGQKKRGKKVWSAFVKEGGLQSFIDFANETIDDEFLSSPFNEEYR